MLLDKLKTREDRLWYAQKAVEHNWSRNILVMQIESRLIDRSGGAVTNFALTLPKPQSDLTRDKTHIVAMTGSYFRGDAEAVLHPDDESKFDAVTYTYYEQLNGYEYLKQLDIGYFFYSGSYVDDITDVLDSNLKTILHISGRLGR